MGKIIKKTYNSLPLIIVAVYPMGLFCIGIGTAALIELVPAGLVFIALGVLLVLMYRGMKNSNVTVYENGISFRNNFGSENKLCCDDVSRGAIGHYGITLFLKNGTKTNCPYDQVFYKILEEKGLIGER